MRKVLVTGGAGFIGYHLSKRLAAANCDVTIAARHAPADAEFAALLAMPNVRMIECDLTERAAWEKLGGGYDAVYHLAGLNGFKQFREIPHEVLRVGITTAMHALEWLRDTNGNPNAKLLFASSNEIYVGAQSAFGKLPVPTPEAVPGVVPDTYDPRWSYGGGKLVAELFFIHYAKAYGLRTVIVRPHYVYGPRAGAEPMIPKIIARALGQLDPFPIIGADDSRSYCYVDDAAEGMVAAMESSATDGGTYHLGSSEEVTVGELNNLVLEFTGWHPENIEYKDSPDGARSRFVPDVSKLKKDTGFEPKTSFREGLRRTVEWYRANPRK